MEIKVRDPKLKALEEAEKEKNALEEIRRMEFFKAMKEHKRFQKYIVEELLQGEIDKLSDLRKFTQEALTKASPEETQRVMLANLAAVKVLEKIKGKLS